MHRTVGGLTKTAPVHSSFIWSPGRSLTSQEGPRPTGRLSVGSFRFPAFFICFYLSRTPPLLAKGAGCVARTSGEGGGGRGILLLTNYITYCPRQIIHEWVVSPQNDSRKLFLVYCKPHEVLVLRLPAIILFLRRLLGKRKKNTARV